MSQIYTQASFITLMCAIDFIENSSNIKSNLISNTRTFYDDNCDSSKKLHKKINMGKQVSVNAIHRSKHNIGQPQWRGYSH
jgi:hypothetical protein